MLVLKRTNWWVRWVKFVVPKSWNTYDNLRWGRPVSLCTLFWSGILPTLFYAFCALWAILLPTMIVLNIIQVGHVKEWTLSITLFAAVIGLLVWRDHYATKTDVPFVPTAVETVFWGIKHRVCPLVKVEEEDDDVDQ